ncbi:hypothetical protein Tcan_11587 [Toxocara canis]|uniref:Pepsin inhibitor-3-like repeated domain-containing protein n=1 Tax=Toxocara canis TaxID=6265 RepID=A0A0B2VXW1_TOXCA|nr:hypothetical protein Tcan_11587 [Toxocara canis]
MCIFNRSRAATVIALLFGTVTVLCAPAPQNGQLVTYPPLPWNGGGYTMPGGNPDTFPTGIHGGGYPFNGNGIWIDQLQLSANCSIKDDVLYVNGVSKGYLTPQQQIELQQFQEEAMNWSEAFITIIEKDDVLYVNGVSKGYLTPQQQIELQQFQEEAMNWSEAFITIIEKQVVQGLGGIFGEGSTMHIFQPHADQSNTQQMQYPTTYQPGSIPSLPPFPEFPPFCK